jgi:beta-N-acetylhexosaminidase
MAATHWYPPQVTVLIVGDKVGGVTCIGVSQEISMPGLGLGLLCAAIEQLKLRGLTSCFVDWVLILQYFSC